MYFRENFASSLRCLPSHFRLVQAVESALHHGSLEGIDALLGNVLNNAICIEQENSSNKPD